MLHSGVGRLFSPRGWVSGAIDFLATAGGDFCYLMGAGRILLLSERAGRLLLPSGVTFSHSGYFYCFWWLFSGESWDTFVTIGDFCYFRWKFRYIRVAFVAFGSGGWTTFVTIGGDFYLLPLGVGGRETLTSLRRS